MYETIEKSDNFKLSRRVKLKNAELRAVTVEILYEICEPERQRERQKQRARDKKRQIKSMRNCVCDYM